MKNNKNKMFALLIAIIMFSFSLSGCTETKDVAVQPDNAKQIDVAIQFTDDDGREIAIDEPCSRIISLYSAHTENLFELGAGNLIIGVHDTSIYPPETQKIPIYDYTDDPEKIIAADPDLVLIRPFITRKVPDFVEAIENAGITVVSLYPEKFEDFDDYIEKLSLLTGTEEVAKEKLALFHENIDDVSSKTKSVIEKQRIFFEATEANLRTITEESMAAHAIAFAGGINIAEKAEAVEEGSSIATFGVEKILSLADDIDVYVSQRGAMNAGGNLHSIFIRPGFDTIKAIKDKRVYILNEKIISSPTFRFYKGVRELSRYLYPDVVDNISEYEVDDAADKRDFANIMVRQLHIPIYITSSSKYYETDTKGHIYGMFSDVTWQDDDFDYIETCAMGGYIPYKEDGEQQYFEPDSNVTREMLAQTIFLTGDFKRTAEATPINDLDQCDNANIVQILVDNGVFSLNQGNFEPGRNVTCNEIIDALKFVSYTVSDL
ncbi:MAG: ABC transporter substrate-binding protein [Sedimentibacter sp.]|uniref:ABC transporter substrate-binding protein n=1 Tax=Sedimentibacter sp. TaxID=1960295 RepID=UPI002981CC9E|nr:ABC transporter substrate-binding protein [Sedimentibacter sp.]MDW5299307.1 ABC transporter substrate-binding protein [Sedimentibacter sp.]